MRTTQTTWGQALILTIRNVPGGLNTVVTAIHEELGPFIGSRNTFAKLYGVKDAADLVGPDRLRAWIVLVSIGEDPSDWGIDETTTVPASIDAERLKKQLPLLVIRQYRTGANVVPFLARVRETQRETVRPAA